MTYWGLRQVYILCLQQHYQHPQLDTSSNEIPKSASSHEHAGRHWRPWTKARRMGDYMSGGRRSRSWFH